LQVSIEAKYYNSILLVQEKNHFLNYDCDAHDKRQRSF